MTKIRDLLATGPTLSFEFFPPKSEAAEARLVETIGVLGKWKPDFVSVTYGAGGTTRDTTRDIVVRMCEEQDFPAMPHLTCVGHTRGEIADLLDDYQAHGVHNVLALAGDPQPGMDDPGDFRYALDLVQEIRGRTDMCVGVAAFPEVHPRSPSRESDRRHLAEKLSAADFGITQFFFDADDYLRMVDELADLGCTTPVVPGVIPPVNPVTVARFAEMNGTAIPRELFDRILAVADDARLELAVDAAVGLIGELVDRGVPGVHVYTLNSAHAASRICERIELPGRP